MHLTNALSALSLILPASASAIQRRQLDFLANAASYVLPTSQTSKVEQLTPTTGVKGAKRVKITYSPWQLRAANDTKSFVGNFISMDPAGTAHMYNVNMGFPRKVVVLESRTFIIQPDGARADASTGVYTHHLFFADVSKKKVDPLKCKERQTGFINPFSLNSGSPISVFSGSAEDEAEISYVSRMPEFSTGYYIESKDRVIFSADLVNYRNFTQSIQVVIELEYLEGKPTNFLDTHVATINVGMCNGTSGIVHPPKGAKMFTIGSKEMIVSRNTRFQKLTGHLHDGGVSIELILNGNSTCASNAIYGPVSKSPSGMTGHAHGRRAIGDDAEKEAPPWQTIKKMTQCGDHVDVREGDVVKIMAHYDLDKYPQRMQKDGGMAEEMAMLGGHMGGASNGLLFTNVHAREFWAMSLPVLCEPDFKYDTSTAGSYLCAVLEYPEERIVVLITWLNFALAIVLYGPPGYILSLLRATT